MTKRKYLALGLAGIIAFSPLAVKAGNDLNMINQDKEVISEQEEIEEAVKFIQYKGKITDIVKDEERGNLSILVEGEDRNLLAKIVFHISEDMTILSAKTKDFVARDDLREGDPIIAYYRENTPMTMSIPPQMSPNMILVDDSQEIGFIKVGHFNSELVDMDNELKLNIWEDTAMIDIDGDLVEEKHLANKELMVFYTMATRSIPAQTSPEKVIVLENVMAAEADNLEEMITSLDKIMLNGQTMELDHEIYKTDDGVYMIALRPIGEALGYEVVWNGEERSVELIKGSQWTKLTLGQDQYNFAKMLVKLGKAPELKNSKTYVPVDFIEEILKQDVDVNEGILQIK